MAQILSADRFGLLQKNTNTQVQLNLSSRSDIAITVGGQQYQSTSVLVLNTGISGAGGLDTGSMVSGTPYYVYGVVSNGSPVLVASTSSSAPSGFNVSKLVAYFNTDGSGNVNSVFTVGQIKKDTQTILTSGSTYYTPAGCTRLRARLVAGGGGGGANGSGQSGGSTTFDTLTATGGSPGANGTEGGIGGTGTIGSGWSGFVVQGQGGNPATSRSGPLEGSNGGVSPFCGNTRGGYSSDAASGGTNSGSGGGGAGANGATGTGAAGGGAGGYIDAKTTGLPSASYSFSIGSGGLGAPTGGNFYSGGNGANGQIVIDEEF